MIPRYDAQLADLLAQSLPRLSEPVSALDLACGRGVATRHLLPLLPQGSRLVALSGDRDGLRSLHEQLKPEERSHVFARKESAHRLPFANGVFDLAWVCFAYEPLEPQKTVVRQALRVLKPRSQLLVAVVLRDTFVDLLRQLTTFRGRDDDSQRSRPLIVDHSHVLDLDEWTDLFRRCGAQDIEAEKRRFEVTLGVPPSRDELFTKRLLPQWAGVQPDANADVLRTLDSFVHNPVTFPVTIACIRGYRSAADTLPADDSTVGGRL